MSNKAKTNGKLGTWGIRLLIAGLVVMVLGIVVTALSGCAVAATTGTTSPSAVRTIEPHRMFPYCGGTMIAGACHYLPTRPTAAHRTVHATVTR